MAEERWAASREGGVEDRRRTRCGGSEAVAEAACDVLIFDLDFQIPKPG